MESPDRSKVWLIVGLYKPTEVNRFIKLKFIKLASQYALQMLKFRVESAELPDILTPADAVQETILYRAHNTALDTYSEQLPKVRDLQ